MAEGFDHGHPTRWDGERWVYADTGEPVEGNPRPCPRCGRPSTPEGHDACLGFISGARSACCGHGVKPGFVTFDPEPYRNRPGEGEEGE